MKQQWIQHLTQCIEESCDTPLFGHPPPFNMPKFTEQLKEMLHLDSLEIRCENEGWHPQDQLLNNLGNQPSVLPISLSPIESNLFWAMSQEDILEFSSWTLSVEQKQFNFTDPDMQKGYYHYCIAQALQSFRNSQVYPTLSPKIDKAPIAKEKAFTIDIALEHGGKTVWGRLIIPRTFQQAFKQHFNGQMPSLRELKTHSQMQLQTSLLAGNVLLHPQEIKAIQPGDFVILDHCSFHPKTHKGYLQLNLSKHPLFQMKLKEKTLKVLDYAYEMEGPIMDHEENTHQDSQPIEEILGSQDQPMDHEEEMMEHPPLNQEMPPEDSSPQHEMQDPSVASEEETQSTQNIDSEEVVQPSDEKMVHPNQVPLQLSIEVAKLNISLEKLLELQPGSVLNTSIHPERGVNLSLNGKVIGKGELLQVGDALGVKITEIAK